MKKSIAIFLASLVVLTIMAFTTITGFDMGVIKIPSASEGIRQGLDLRGGSVITYEAQIEEGMDPEQLRNDIQAAQSVLRKRLDSSGFSEATVQILGNNRRIRVEIPDIEDPEKAVQQLGRTAVLEFRDADDNVILTGKDIKNAAAVFNTTGQGTRPEHHIQLEFSSEAVSKFTEATKKAAGRESEQKNYISIVLDEEIVSQPRVDSEYATTGINSQNVIIQLGDDKRYTTEGRDETRTISNLINSGRLPFELKEVELRSVGPTLGEKALETSVLAGIIGMIIVVLFMVFMYRLPGVSSAIALLFYALLMVIVLSVFKINLSLPGIAGIILTVGMAVDANVIIFERIKEELRSGKTLKASIDAGFKRAFTAILDSNITTLIAAVVLYIFGTGAISGFAITLGIGVVLSMFTVLVVSRYLLYQLVGMNIKSLKAYGA